MSTLDINEAKEFLQFLSTTALKDYVHSDVPKSTPFTCIRQRIPGNTNIVNAKRIHYNGRRHCWDWRAYDAQDYINLDVPAYTEMLLLEKCVEYYPVPLWIRSSIARSLEMAQRSLEVDCDLGIIDPLGAATNNKLMELYICMLSGSKLRKCSVLQSWLTRKELQYIFVPVTGTIKSAVIKMKLAARLAGTPNARNVANNMGNILYNHRLTNLYNKHIPESLPYFAAFFDWLVKEISNRQFNITDIDMLEEILDYLYMRCDVAERIIYDHRIFRRSYNELAQLSFDWHQEQTQIEDSQLKKISWSASKNLPKTVSVPGKSTMYWELIELTDAAMLAQESKIMSHCVRSYTQDCTHSDCRIVSAKLLVDGKPSEKRSDRLTIELRGNRKAIAQVKGLANRSPTEIEKQMIRNLADTIGYTTLYDSITLMREPDHYYNVLIPYDELHNLA